MSLPGGTTTASVKGAAAAAGVGAFAHPGATARACRALVALEHVLHVLGPQVHSWLHTTLFLAGRTRPELAGSPAAGARVFAGACALCDSKAGPKNTRHPRG